MVDSNEVLLSLTPFLLDFLGWLLLKTKHLDFNIFLIERFKWLTDYLGILGIVMLKFKY